MARSDPYRLFRFRVEFNNVVHGGFTRVKGMMRDTRVESYREGGVNDYEHKLITQVSYPVLVLERGLVLDDLWKWALDAADGKVQRTTIRIRLQDEANARQWAWQIEHALPVKWTVSDLDAQTAPVVMETLELAHHGLRKAT